MTVGQVTKLFTYTLRLGYQAEVHYTEIRGVPHWSNRGIVLRCRRGTELWAYVWGHRDWPPLMRYFRELDRTEGTER